MSKPKITVVLKLDEQDHEKFGVVKNHLGITRGTELFKHLLYAEYNKIKAGVA